MLCYESIIKSVIDCYPELVPEDIQLGTPPALEMGDVAIPAFIPAKKRKVAPHVMAQDMAQRVSFDECVATATASGPYLNLFFDRKRVGFAMLRDILLAGDCWGAGGSGRGKRVLIEHTSINPNASPHVGRGRCAMIGDSLARLMRFEGYDVEVHYYVNDMGRQIGLLVLVASELEGVTFDRMLDIYVAANQRAKDDPEFAARGYELLVKMEAGDPETREKFYRVTELCLQGQLEVLRRLNVSYDCFDHESVYVNDPRWPAIEAALEGRGAIFTDEEGRRVVDLSRLGYGAEEGRYFVLRRANGSSMYGCRDLLYSLDKHGRNADINIMVLGEDHKLYAQQLALILDAAGIPAPEAIYYSYIRLSQGIMSTREGNVVLLSDFLDQASAISQDRVTEQFPDLSEDDRRVIADLVAVSAIRFAVLRVKPAKNVIFDLETALSFNGDTGPYMLYCCARIRSILRKWDREIPDLSREAFQVTTDQEWMLLKTMAQLPKVVSDSMIQHNCAPIANYALELAHVFTAFYHECPVLTADNEATLHMRLRLCEAALQTLSNALGILGIDTPERM
ncbi:MAG TPA: arginine--tRNA ligase [Candidatus Hydrogenedentes bacterium]|nr:arginine--tRNA ligase [Candidatus Hydrogenedentota bacterium]